MTDFEDDDILDKWLKDGEGRGGSYTIPTDFTESTTGGTKNGYELPNYTLCDKGTCRSITDSTWENLWTNCIASPDEENKDGCYNMITTEVMRDYSPSGLDYRDQECNDDTSTFNPRTCKCSSGNLDANIKDHRTSGQAGWCWEFNNKKGHRPAYPVNVIHGIPNDHVITDDDGYTQPCLGYYPRQFTCNRDGENDDGIGRDSNHPGCGERIDDGDVPPDDKEMAIKLCARATSD